MKPEVKQIVENAVSNLAKAEEETLLVGDESFVNAFNICKHILQMSLDVIERGNKLDINIQTTEKQ